MKTLTGLLLSTLLTMGAGCARTDWIDRTLVTVDVTGTWYGTPSSGGGVSREFLLELKQEGSKVTGSMRTSPAGSIEGTVAGDVFRFRNPRGTFEGELTVSGDEMNGRVSFWAGTVPISLRRVDPSSLPASTSVPR